MALVNKTFSDIITFTRASTATFFNSAGVLTSAATNAPRFDYNPSTLAAQGLLIEESRTNSVLQSQDFTTTWLSTSTSITPNTTFAPDGTLTADTLTWGALSTAEVYQLITLTAVSWTFSVWAKTASGTKKFRLKYYNGTVDTFSTEQVATTTWQRFSFVITGAAASGNVSIRNSSPAEAGDLIVWGAQLEAGAFPTSYIPTTTTALTRAADVASVNTLSPWYNAAEGTLYAEAQVDTNRNYAGTFRHTVNITPTANSDSGLGLLVNTTNTFEYSVRDNSVTVAQLNTGTNTGVVFKIAGAYQVNNFAFSANGGTPVTDTSGAVPTTPAVTQMKIGGVRDGNALGQFNGYLRRITYYPRRLANAELQAITT